MTPADRDLIMGRVTAVWPTPKFHDPTLLVWHEHLGPLGYERMAAAIAGLERTCARRPSLADLHAAYDAEHTGRERSAPPPVCALCENGFVDHTPDLTGGAHTYGRCPNGCRPMTVDQRAAFLRAEDDAWARRHRPDRKRVDQLAMSAVDPSAPRDRGEDLDF